MKHLFYIVTTIFFFHWSSAQNADCISAQALCSNPNFAFNAVVNNGAVNDLPGTNSVSNPSTNPFSTNSGCLLSGENNPQWLIITIGNAGTLEFIFGAGNSSNPQAGYYDWAMWPYNATTCNGIINNTLPPIRCNWNGSSSGGTGVASAANIPPGGSASNFEPPLQVQACQQFIICISNYSNINTNVSFLSVGTASLSCSPSCNPNYAICAGNSATIVPVNFAGLTNPTYSIQPGGLTSSTPSLVVTPSVTTNYTVFITGTNTSSAVVTNTSVSTVTVNPVPVVSHTVIQPSCTNTLASVNFTLGTNVPASNPQYTFTWNPATAPPGAPANPVTGTTFTANPNPGTTAYTVALPGGCTTTGNFVINNVPPPVSFTIANTSQSNSITCANPTVTLVNSSTYTAGTLSYTWTSLSFSATGGTVNLTQPMTLTCVAVDPVTTCSAINVFAVGINTTSPVMAITPTAQAINCSSLSVATFTGTAFSPTVNMTHLWYSAPNVPPATAQGTTSLWQAGPGTYTYCLRNDINGCTTCSNVVVTTNQSSVNFSLTSTTNFSVGCAPLRNTTTVNVVGAVSSGSVQPVITYTFLPPGYTGTTVTFNSNASMTTAIPGQWTVMVQDGNSFCVTSKVFSILQNTIAPHSQISINSLSVTALNLDCYTPSVTAVGSSTTSNTSVIWITPGGTNIPQSSIPISTTTNSTSTTVGTYDLQVTNQANGCVTTQPFIVTQSIQVPSVTVIKSTAPASINCYGNPVVLNYSMTSTIPVVSSVISWNGPSPQVTGNQSSYNALVVGVYTVVARNTVNGCIGTGTTNVGPDLTPPILTPPSSPFVLDCGQPSVRISPVISNTLSSYSYSWTALTTSNNVGITPLTIQGSPFTNVTKPGIYRVTVLNLNNGCRANTTVEVVDGTLNSGFTSNPSTGFAPLTVGFNNTSASTGSAATASITSHWAFGNGSVLSTSVNNTPSTVYTSPGTYTVMLIAQKGNCLDTSSAIIVVDAPSNIEIPNVFTPNGDGSNDKFFLRTQNITEIEARIYDRWGNLVFEMISDKGNIEWDGKNQYAKECSAGTYFYVIKTKGKDDKTTEQKGTISLYR